MLGWRTLLPLAGLSAMLAWPAESGAQSIWFEPLNDRELYLEVLKPSFSGGNAGFLTTSWYLSGRLALKKNIFLVAELPFAYASADRELDVLDVSDATIGDPYIGVEGRSSSSGVFGEFGIRLPFASQSSSATLTGLFTDFVDRAEAFLPDVLSMVGALDYELQNPSGFGARFRAGSVVWLDVGDSASDTEVNVIFSGQTWYDVERVVIGGGLSGRWVVTSDAGFGDASAFQLMLLTSLRLGQFRPGIQVRVPLDENFNQLVDVVIGVNVALAFR